MCWPSFFIDCGVTAVLAVVAWAYALTVRDLRDQDAMIAACEAEKANARTGCAGCPLAARDKALEAVVALPAWSYLAPLLGLRPIYRELRLARNRLRQPGGETRKDGTLVPNQQRMGPITLPARLDALERILAIQAACNTEADRLGRPRVDLLNAEEEARIRELIAAGAWPQKWTGDELAADVPLDVVFSDGSVQPLLIGAGAR